MVEGEELASLPCSRLALLSLRFNLELWVTHIPANEMEILKNNSAIRDTEYSGDLRDRA